MVDIPEFKRDESLDYLKVMRALIELPFPVGRALLIDFLKGNRMNKSIIKHDLDEKNNFGLLRPLDSHKISALIDLLTVEGFIELTTTEKNNFMFVYRVTLKGHKEILSPTFNAKRDKPLMKQFSTKISEEDKIVFEENKEFLEEYNEEQKKAIISQNKNILCIAGAGSGKTTVLVKRIEFLVNKKRVIPEKILAITFTRKAMGEMRERLEKAGISGVIVETFNSFCEKILRRNSYLIYNKPVRLISYSEKIQIVRAALFEGGMEIYDALEIYFSEAQRRNKTPEKLFNLFISDCFSVLDYFKIKNGALVDFRDNSESNNSLNLVYNVCSYVEKMMKEKGLRDFTDQIIDALEFFKKYPDRIPLFSHVLVDEYQDVNSIQIELLDLILPSNLFCVGDPRQAIFGWRGSDIKYILNLPDKYPTCEIINLVKNYRSDKKIVEFMNEVISSLKLPDLVHHNDYSGELKIHEFDSADEELGFVFSKILALKESGEKIFVLARTNKQLEEMATLLKNAGIQYLFKEEDSEENFEENKIILGTVHSIKGLEADNVFVIGCNVSNFPCKVSDHPVLEMIKLSDYDKEDEERRVFYVAVSRAKKNLYLTYSGKKSYYIKA